MKNKKSNTQKKKRKIDPNELWVGMPEFNQPGIKPLKSIKVNFLDQAGMIKFAKLVGQNITAKTRSIWFPEVPEEPLMDKRYISKKK